MISVITAGIESHDSEDMRDSTVYWIHKKIACWSRWSGWRPVGPACVKRVSPERNVNWLVALRILVGPAAPAYRPLQWAPRDVPPYSVSVPWDATECTVKMVRVSARIQTLLRILSICKMINGYFFVARLMRTEPNHVMKLWCNFFLTAWH